MDITIKKFEATKAELNDLQQIIIKQNSANEKITSKVEVQAQQVAQLIEEKENWQKQYQYLEVQHNKLKQSSEEKEAKQQNEMQNYHKLELRIQQEIANQQSEKARLEESVIQIRALKDRISHLQMENKQLYE